MLTKGENTWEQIGRAYNFNKVYPALIANVFVCYFFKVT